MLSAFLGIYYIFTIIHSIVTVCPNDDEDSRCSDQFFVLLPPDHTKCINVEFTQCLAPKDAFNCSESIVTAITPTLVALECYSALVAYDTDIINGPPMVLYGNSSSEKQYLVMLMEEEYWDYYVRWLVVDISADDLAMGIMDDGLTLLDYEVPPSYTYMLHYFAVYVFEYDEAMAAAQRARLSGSPRHFKKTAEFFSRNNLCMRPVARLVYSVTYADVFTGSGPAALMGGREVHVRAPTVIPTTTQSTTPADACSVDLARDLCTKEEGVYRRLHLRRPRTCGDYVSADQVAEKLEVSGVVRAYFKYILLMVDKDEYRTDDDLFQVHMLIMDIEREHLFDGPEKATVVVDYLPPMPLDAAHQYNLYLWLQPSNMTSDLLLGGRSPTHLDPFNLREFVRRVGLCGRLFAGYRFRVHKYTAPEGLSRKRSLNVDTACTRALVCKPPAPHFPVLVMSVAEQCGQAVTTETDVSSAPTIMFSTADKTTTYLLLMVDSTVQLGHRRHWLVSNITGASLQKGMSVSDGTVVSSYVAPRSANTSDVRLIQFFLFTQPPGQSITPLPPQGPRPFDAVAFIKGHDLCDKLAASSEYRFAVAADTEAMRSGRLLQAAATRGAVVSVILLAICLFVLH